MSEYSPQEQAAYDFGFKLGKSTCAEQLAAERERRRTPRNGGEMSEEPKPAGEWTKDILDELSKRLPAGYHFGQLVADAHNAALDAEREHGQQECDRLDAFWQNQLAAERQRCESFKNLCLGVERQLAAEREKLAAAQSGNKAAKAFMDYLRANTGVSDEWPIELKVAEDSIDPINTLLNQFEQTIYATDTTALDAAIAERITTRVLRLREEEVQPLVDALYDIAENDTYTGSERIYVAKQALAKVKAKP